MSTQNGLSRLDFIMLVIVICILITVYLARFEPLLASSERVALRQTYQSLYLSTRLEFMSNVGRDRLNQLAQQACLNPMDYTATKPSNYLGAFEHPDPLLLPLGHWYFDDTECQLVYKIQFTQGFDTTLLPSPARIRFAVRKIFSAPNKDGHRTLEDLRLEPLEAPEALKPLEIYRWH